MLTMVQIQCFADFLKLKVTALCRPVQKMLKYSQAAC